jgi:hypothetical protein
MVNLSCTDHKHPLMFTKFDRNLSMACIKKNLLDSILLLYVENISNIFRVNKRLSRIFSRKETEEENR